MILIGELALWVALLMAAWSAITSFAGGKLGRNDLIMSGERGVNATWILVVAASLGLWTALLTHDFSFGYVAANTSANLPAIYSFTSFWSGRAGSLLFLALLLSTCSVVCVFANRDSNRELMPYVSGTLATVMLFLLATMCFGANPYERLDWLPPDGRGLHPQLQHPGAAVHTPTVYLGYVAATIPFAFGVAALITRGFDERWVGAVRRWSLLSWFCLTVGIVLGMRRAYVEAGGSGLWAWDSVGSSSLLLWLIMTAFLLWVMVRERRGRHYGRYVVLAGVVMLFAGFAGQRFRKDYDVQLRPGATFTQRDPYGTEWTFTSQGVSRFDKLNRDVVAVALQTTRNGKPMGIISSEKRQYVDGRGVATFEPSTDVGIRTTLSQDTHVVLAGVSEDETAELRISFNPLVMLVWIGGALIAVGGLIVMRPALS